MKLFKDDAIDHKDSDIEKIQTKPNMYISYLGRKGSLHLGKETVNNAIDECINPNSPGDEIIINLDENVNTLTVIDNGRGIPFDKLELVCTTLQSGSKFYREGSGGSAGENGTGLTAINALSEVFELKSQRYGEKAILSFEKGKRIGEGPSIKKTNNDKHGTTVIFKPNPFFMGLDCLLSGADLHTWLDKISFLIPSKIKMTLNINSIGKESVVQKKYKNKNGLYDYIKRECKKPLIDPIHFMKSTRIKEIVPIVEIDPTTKKQVSHNKEIDRFIGIEVAFTFNSSSTETFIDSFCNFINTVDNGVHANAVKTAIQQFLIRKVKDSLSEKEAKKIDVTFNDIEQGLFLSLYLSTDMQPQFASQTKEKMSSDEFFKPIRDLTFRGLDEYFKKQPKELKRVIDFIKTNAKARIEANKVRNSVIKGETNNFDEHKIKNFIPANNRGRNDYRELFLIEGDSALGSARLGRFSNDTQALFGLKGVPLNSFGLQLDKVLLNNEFKNLVKILGCNIGARFDLLKIKYNKIIIMTDADIDGNFITSLLCVFFLIHLREVVEAGLLYKAVTPLYKIDDKKKPFILNKTEYINVFEKRIRNNIKLVNPTNNHILQEEEMKILLLSNRDYLEELNRLSNHFAVKKDIVEFLCIHYGESDFDKKFKKKFPELTIDNDSVLSGIYEGKYQILIIDKIFFKRAKTMIDFIKNINNNNVYFIVHEINGKNTTTDKGVMTLGEFLSMAQKFQPTILMRYKGLGELDPEKLRDTTLDPNNRELIRLTISDLEKEVEKFNILHGDESNERKKLMKHFKINREDLDN